MTMTDQKKVFFKIKTPLSEHLNDLGDLPGDFNGLFYFAFLCPRLRLNR